LGLVAAKAANSGSVVYYLAALVVVVPFVAAIAGGFRRLCIAVLIFDIPLMWDVNLFFQGDDPYPGGLNLSLTTLAIAGLYGLWASEAAVGGDSARRTKLRFDAIATVYVAFTLLSLVVASDKLLAVFGIALLVQTFLVFLYLSNSVRGREDFVFIIGVLVAAVALEAVAVIAAWGAGHNFSFSPLSSGGGDVRDADEVFRPAGTLRQPNVAGSFLAASLAPVLMVAAARFRPWLRAVSAVVFALGVVALVLTASRGGWLGFVLAMLFLAVVGVRRGVLKLRLVLLALLVVVAVAFSFADTITARLSDDGGAAAGRVPLMEIAWNMVQARPVLGIGLNNFSTVLPDFAGPRFSGDWLAVVHNQYLLIWAETGTAALGAFLLFLAATIRRAWGASACADPQLAAIAIGLAAAVVGLLPNMAVERFVNRPQLGLLWLFGALSLALHRQASQARAEDRSHARAAPPSARRSVAAPPLGTFPLRSGRSF
jgi:putative inorganic carbon (hco3(-)) transporter